MGIAEMICRHHYLAVRRKLISTFQVPLLFLNSGLWLISLTGSRLFVPKLPHIFGSSVHCKDQKLWLGQGDAVRGGIDGGGGDAGRGGKGMN